MKSAVGLSVLVSLLLLAGCAKSTNPVASDNGMQSVNLAVGFSNAATQGLGKVGGVLAADSLRIDSAIVVFQRIKFESHIDSVGVDTTGHDLDDDTELNVIFKGPFVVHVRDTLAIDFANQMLPAGTYDGIKFKIHRITPAEPFEDSDEFNHHPRMRSDTSFMGASIVVWGAVLQSGTWVPFTYKFYGEVEFKIKGNFTVDAATSTVNIALRFDMGFWFRNPFTGALLDPTDGSFFTRQMIDMAIRMSFQHGRGGHDDNHDGHPDHD